MFCRSANGVTLRRGSECPIIAYRPLWRWTIGGDSAGELQSPLWHGHLGRETRAGCPCHVRLADFAVLLGDSARARRPARPFVRPLGVGIEKEPSMSMDRWIRATILAKGKAVPHQKRNVRAFSLVVRQVHFDRLLGWQLHCHPGCGSTTAAPTNLSFSGWRTTRKRHAITTHR